TREDVVPPIALSKLADNPVNNQPGWNFTQDVRNREMLSPTNERGDRWLLDRILTALWLREQFVEIGATNSQVIWHQKAVADYLSRVDRFLERLLLLVHLTGGQPGRATELLSLRHSNTVQGRHRNMFMEHGL
ncbi:hypothetical protein PHISCL_10682, partial [Aspergillus sclerotialis]